VNTPQKQIIYPKYDLYTSMQIDSLKDEIGEIRDKVNNTPDIPAQSTKDNFSDDSEELIVEDSVGDPLETPISYDITTISGLSIDDYNDILDSLQLSQNSILNNIATSLYNAENEYNVNGVFILAVAIRMTNYGVRGNAIDNNNLFGLLSSDHMSYRKYSNPDESIKYFAKLMRIYYFDRNIDTIDEVSKKYVSNKSSKWSNDISEIIKNIKQIIESK
jgi:flagellum-specific peptidoglycan hydrolase FlgJ